MSKKFFPQELIEQINEFKNYSIIKINEKEPFDYIQNFGMQILKFLMQINSIFILFQKKI